MATVVVEMERKKEYAVIGGETHKLHRHHHAEPAPTDWPPTSVGQDATRRSSRLCVVHECPSGSWARYRPGKFGSSERGRAPGTLGTEESQSDSLADSSAGRAARRAEGRRTVSSSTCRCTFAFVNTGRPGDKLMTAPPFFEPGMHPTEWGRKTHHEPAPQTGLRAQLARAVHLTLRSLRVLATEPRMIALPFLALVFTGFVWLIVVLSVLALGLPPTSPSSGFLYQEIFVAYLVTYFLSVYFMAAIIGAPSIRLHGERPHVP